MLVKIVSMTIQIGSSKTAANKIRQRRYRNKMKSLELSLVQVWVPHDRVLEIRAIAARMKAESSEDYEPSGRQLAFAQLICDSRGLTLRQEHLSSTRKLSSWIRKNRKKRNNFLTG